MRMTALECGCQKSILDVILDCFPPYNLRQGLELKVKFIDLTRLVAQ